MTLTAASHTATAPRHCPPSPPSPILCPRVRKPCHLLSRLLPWSDRCPDVICLHLWPPSVLLVQMVTDGVRRESCCFFIYVKCIGSSCFWELKPAPLAIPPQRSLLFQPSSFKMSLPPPPLLQALMFRVQCHWTISESPFFFFLLLCFAPCLARERLGARVLRCVSHPLFTHPQRFKSF